MNSIDLQARTVVLRFAAPAPARLERIGNGHINDTWHAVPARPEQESLLLQRLNRHVFPRGPEVMANIAAVTSHLRRRVAEAGALDVQRQVLQLIETTSGTPYLTDDEGWIWRTYRFIGGCRDLARAPSPFEAGEVAAAFGRFQCHLADFSAPPLVETIPEFHHTRRRFEALLAALADDPLQRSTMARAEIAECLAREGLVDRLVDLQSSGAIPTRIAHNDAKVSNVLLDDASGRALAVIDLDTVMPGLALHDFGDLVRTAATRSAEDEEDLAQVSIDLALFKAVARGFLSTAGAVLTESERDHLVLAGRLIVFEQALRFLTDWLRGDRYYKVRDSGHNLRRARAQLALVRSIEAQDEALRAIVEAAD